MSTSRPTIAVPAHVGSYAEDDVTMLLQELDAADLERPTAEREALMQNGGHYSETLPIEYQPTAEYEALFDRLLASSAERIALRTQVLARRIVEEHHPEPVLVSLARAGTPVGVLLRRALLREGVDAPHLTISIVRGRGLDVHALDYLLERYAPERIVFVDGWTGKGAIQRELDAALQEYAALRGLGDRAPRPVLAVLADPAHVAELCASRADELIPSACLNSTVSGLISRTVILPELAGRATFHGVKVYREFADRDQSRRYVDTVATFFRDGLDAVVAAARCLDPADGRGLREVQAVQAEHGIDDVHRVKPGIGETTRVLLRRVPERILVDERYRDELAHVLLLAEDRGVPVESRPSLAYACFGLIADRRAS